MKQNIRKRNETEAIVAIGATQQWMKRRKTISEATAVATAATTTARKKNIYKRHTFYIGIENRF